MKQYYYLENGTSIGPVTLNELQEKLMANALTLDSLIYQTGAKEWEKLHDVLAMASSTEIPPPPAGKPNPLVGWISDLKVPCCGEKSKRLKWRQWMLILACLLGLNSVFLLFIQASTKSINKDVTSLSERFSKYAKEAYEYEYKWQRFSRSDYDFDMSRQGKSFDELHIMHFGGWEYVGPLCNDGVNDTFILLRRPKK